MQAERDLGLHVGELFLDELIGGERPAELLAVEHIVAGAMPAELGGAEDAPGDAGARNVETAERAGAGRRHSAADSLPGTTAPSSTISPVMEARSDSLPSIFGVEKPLVPRSTMKPRILPSSFAQTTAMSATGELVIQIFAPVRLIAVGDLLGAGHHRAGIGAVVGFGEAEAADEFAGRELGQIFAALRFAAVGIDRVHDEGGLHRHHRAVAGIDPLDFAGDQAVGDVAEAGAAVFLRDGRAEKAELAHLEDHGRIVFLLAISGDHARKQFLLGVIARGVAHHPLLFGQFTFEIERIFPFEGGILDLDRFAFALLRKLRHGSTPCWP